MTKVTILKTHIVAIVVFLRARFTDLTRMSGIAILAAVAIWWPTYNAHRDWEPGSDRSLIAWGGTMTDSREPSLIVRATIGSGTLRVDYEVMNKLTVPIYVFDQLYDMKSERLDPDWLYIEITGRHVVISRQVWPLPVGLHHENPEVPYARILNTGSKLTTSFSRLLPLAETDPYFHIRNQAGLPKTFQKGDEITFKLGWAPAADLHGGVPAEINGEKLILFPYNEAIRKQRLTISLPIRPDVPMPARK